MLESAREIQCLPLPYCPTNSKRSGASSFSVRRAEMTVYGAPKGSAIHPSICVESAKLNLPIHSHAPKGRSVVQVPTTSMGNWVLDLLGKCKALSPCCCLGCAHGREVVLRNWCSHEQQDGAKCTSNGNINGSCGSIGLGNVTKQPH